MLQTTSWTCSPTCVLVPRSPWGGYPKRGFLFSVPGGSFSGPPKMLILPQNGRKWPKMAKKGPKNVPKMRKKCTFAQKSKNARFSVAFEGRQDFKKGVAPLFGAPDCGETGGKFSGNFRILGGSPKPHKMAKNGQNGRFWTPPGPKFFSGPHKNGARNVAKIWP